MRSLIAAACLTLPLIASAINYQGPLTVDDNYIKAHGPIVIGNFQGTTSQPAINVSTAQPVIIAFSNLTGPGDMIYGVGSNVTVLFNKATATNPNNGSQKGMFLHIEQAVNVLAQNNTADGFRFGVYINRYVGNNSQGQTIRIMNNTISNCDARPSDGNGGYAKSGQWNGHAIQLNAVQNLPLVEIAWNQLINVPRQSQCADIINMFQSSGTSASHILIHDNYLSGALPANPGVDGYSGGGIITDGTAADSAATASAFVDMYNNQVVATANYGLSIAAGHDVTIYNNRVVSSGHLSDGTFYPTTYGNAYNNYNNYKQPASTMFNDIVKNNFAGLIRKDSSGNPMRSDTYLPNQASGSSATTYFSPNDTAHPTITDEATELASWQSKLSSNSVLVGTGN